MLAHAGLALAVGLGACLNGLLLYIGLVRRGIYMPSAGWGKFLLQLLGACLVIAGVLLWLRQSFDWVGLRHTPVVRLGLLGSSLVAIGALYFGMLWAMGFKYTFFRRRVS
jgi:putative peptidoglycan lipid II flippase